MFSMLKNYLLVSSRNIRQQKLYSIIIISGLVVGLTMFILGALFADFHFGFDQFHKDIDRTYLLTRIITSKNVDERHTFFVHSPVYSLIKEKFPEIDEAIRVIPLGRRIVHHNREVFYENEVMTADENFFSFFSFKLLMGNPEQALKAPNSVVLTKSGAKKYFGNEDPIGKILDVDIDGKKSLMVTGVTEDIPKDSTIEYSLLISAKTFNWLESWKLQTTIFVKLKKVTAPENVAGRLPQFTREHLPLYDDNNERVYLFPFENLHLGTVDFLGPYGLKTESPVQFYFVMGVAISLLLIVCINFANLSTARYMSRAKEIGLRKTMGASRQQLISQFLGEAVFLSFIAFPLSILCFEFIKPAFLSIIGTNIKLNLWQNPFMIIMIFGVSILVGIISGCYPAFFLSRFKPAEVLKGKINARMKGTAARKTMVITQFSLSVILIIGTIVIIRQFDFLLQVDLGYNRENIITLPVQEIDPQRLEPIKNELSKHPQITHISFANWVPINWAPEYKVRPEGFSNQDSFILNGYPVNYDFTETIGMKIIKGRSFSKEFKDENNFLISQSAASAFGWEDPVGKQLTVDNQKGKVIGMVKDFHFNHVFKTASPNLLKLETRWLYYMFVKTPDGINQDILHYIGTKWKTIFPDVPFEYSTLDHLFNEAYRRMIKSSEFFKMVSIISIFISCLGLIGLSSYTIEKKRKEIGIRKVLGASELQVINMFVTEFVKLVIISNIIAFPIAYYFAHWFLNWAWVYRINTGAFVFIITAILSLLSALVSVIPQTVKAAAANPVDVIKYE